MRNIKLILEYDGTNYAGWQRQYNADTIQEKIEKAILITTKEKSEVIGSSRTDAGVHAKGFVCNFKTSSKIPESKFKEALNTKLPNDIVILDSREVPINFHSRYDSKGKTYSYTILNRDTPIAIGQNYIYHLKRKLNIDDMIKGANFLIGRNDFSAFKNAGSSVKTSVRTITNIDIVNKGDFVVFTVSADGFLYNMVRIIVGTLIDVGIGKYKPEYIKTILDSKNRANAGKSAPASGLCLEIVYY